MDFISWLIIIFGGFCIIAMIWAYVGFRNVLSALSNVSKEKKEYAEEMTEDGNVQILQPSQITYDRIELEKCRDEYTKNYALYSAANQFITIFPLAGIFGTVRGLIMSDLNNVESLITGLNTALFTTYAGLIASIALKSLDSLLLVRVVSLIEAKFDKFDAAILRQTMKEEIHRERKRAPSSKNTSK